MKALKTVFYLVIVLTIAKCSTDGKLYQSESDISLGNPNKTEITASSDSVQYSIAFDKNQEQLQNRLNIEGVHTYNDALTYKHKKAEKPSNKNSKASPNTFMSIGTVR
jgi:hypothetical protein